MYKQYTTTHETEAGSMRIERTFKIESGVNTLESIIVNVSGLEFELPARMHQTDRTIIRKVCTMVKAIKSA